jgi:Tol biopolymer transport system component
MLTKSGAKLMDFGLARELTPMGRDLEATVTGGGADPDESITKKGTIVGTFQYMAPEQLEGKRADARSDIWALGCVLYEMATGKRAFEGSTPVSVISAIMKDEPRRMSELAPLTPPAFERLVRQCLAKDPDERWQTAGDLRRELSWIESELGVSKQASSKPANRWIWSVPWLMAVGIAVVAVIAVRKPGLPPLALEIGKPPSVASIGSPCLSPDGNVLAFNAVDSGKVSSIWIRDLSSLDAKRLAGTEGASRPFWSPDSRELGYFANGKLFRVSTRGTPPLFLCDSPSGSDGTWGKSGVILFDGGAEDSIQMVAATGGEPRGTVPLDRTTGEYGSYWPAFLPDGDHFFFLTGKHGSERRMLKVGSIRSKEVKSLGQVSSRTEYSSGYALSVSGGALIARRFDPRALSFRGEPVTIAENVDAAQDYAAFSAAQRILTYRTLAPAGSERLVWLSRTGNRLGVVGNLGYYESLALSNDGAHLAFDKTDQAREHGRVWIWDLARNVGIPVSQPDQQALAPAWSPDGRRIAYGMHVPGPFQFDLFVQSADGETAESLLYSSPEVKDVACWSSDGKKLVYMVASPRRASDVDIRALLLPGGTESVPIVATRSSEYHPALSPDGSLLAYERGSTGRAEIYLQRLTGEKNGIAISINGGTQPSWRADGRELYYLSLDGDLMAVTIQPAQGQLSAPKRLFQAPVKVRFNMRNQYVPSADGQRFLFASPEGQSTPEATVVMTRWETLASGK